MPNAVVAGLLPLAPVLFLHVSMSKTSENVAEATVVRPVCFQREIRDREADIEPREPMTSLDGCYVREVTYEEAKQIILRYEWLKSMPLMPLAQYGLFTPDHVMIGVACFGYGNGSNSRKICDEDEARTAAGERSYRDLTVCLERGACVHWAHPHAASFLISRACSQAHRDKGWRIFYAYSDSLAGEIGTVYQACNWHFIGGRGKYRWYFLHVPTKQWYSTRSLRARKGSPTSITRGRTIPEIRTDPEWKAQKRPDKTRYVHFEGTKKQKREMKAALRFPILPYPKRSLAADANPDDLLSPAEYAERMWMVRSLDAQDDKPERDAELAEMFD